MENSGNFEDNGEQNPSHSPPASSVAAVIRTAWPHVVLETRESVNVSCFSDFNYTLSLTTFKISSEFFWVDGYETNCSTALW